MNVLYSLTIPQAQQMIKRKVVSLNASSRKKFESTAFLNVQANDSNTEKKARAIVNGIIK